MDEAVLSARNLIVSKLAKFLEVPIALSEEQDAEAEAPYGYYSFITPYASSGEYGDYVRVIVSDSDISKKHLLTVRSETAEMALSFTFCSTNRKNNQGIQIYGENEAMGLALKATGWLKHAGASILSDHSLVVMGVNNLASRSGIIADEYNRRWGFDVNIRYTAKTIQRDELLTVGIIKEKEE